MRPPVYRCIDCITIYANPDIYIYILYYFIYSSCPSEPICTCHVLPFVTPSYHQPGERGPPPKLFKTAAEEQAWRIQKLLEDPVRHGIVLYANMLTRLCPLALHISPSPAPTAHRPPTCACACCFIIRLPSRIASSPHPNPQIKYDLLYCLSLILFFLRFFFFFLSSYILGEASFYTDCGTTEASSTSGSSRL